MPKKVEISARDFEKPSLILRKAAELVEEEMRDYSEGKWNGRNGVCNALTRFKDFAGVGVDHAVPFYSYVSYQKQAKASSIKGKRLDVVKQAQDIFSEFFKPHKKGSGVYWFGSTFRDEQQNKRIEALLLSAEVAESRGL